MSTTTLSETELDLGPAKQAAQSGPVFITHRGEPTFVILSMENYEHLAKNQKSIGDMLSCPEATEIDLEGVIPPRQIAQFKPVDWD